MTVTLTATYQDGAGTPCSGRVIFRLAEVTTAGTIIYTDHPVSKVLDVTGSLSVALQPTDTMSTTSSYEVTEKLNGSHERQYFVQIPSTPSTQSLSGLRAYSVAPAPQAAPPTHGLLGGLGDDDHPQYVRRDRLWFNVKDYGAVGDGTTDDYAAINAVINAAYAAGGGTVYFPPGTYKITSQLVLPNDGGTGNPNNAPRQPALILRGAGGWATGQEQTGSSTKGGTVLNLTYSSGTYNNAQLVTRGLGNLVIEDLTFTDTTSTPSTPFIMTTNTTLRVSRCAFYGSEYSTPSKDAIVLGGTRKAALNGHSNTYDDANSAFQGYGTVVERNYFDGIRRALYGRSYCNHTVFRDNFVDKGCGSALSGGACIEFDGSLDATGTYADADMCTGNIVTGNYLNGLSYKYQVKITQGVSNVVAFNGSPDPQPSLLALVRCAAGTDGLGTKQAAVRNVITGNHLQQAVSHLSEDSDSAAQNTLIHGAQTETSQIPGWINPTYGWKVKDPTTTVSSVLQVQDTASRAWWDLFGSASNPVFVMHGPLKLDGAAIGGAGSTALTIGDASTADDAVLIFNPPSGKATYMQFKRAGSNSWLVSDLGSGDLYVWDSVNSKSQLQFTAGSGAGGGTTDVNSALKVEGSVGFYGTSPQTKKTVTGSTGGNAALASLLTQLAALGLITNSTT
jgi:hypothetical protein